MKKSALKKIRVSKRSKMAIAAASTMMAVPMLGLPPSVMSQPPTKPGPMTPGIHTTVKNAAYLKYSEMFQKIVGTYSIAGIQGQHLVFRKAGGEFFFIDPGTGDMKFVSAAEWMKYKTLAGAKAWPIKYGGNSQTIKLDALWLKQRQAFGNVTLLGEDASGHDVIKISSGQTVYLDPSTGDFVPVSSK